MKLAYVILALFSSSFAATTVFADTLAVCSVQNGALSYQVSVEKYPGGLPPPQQHMTTLLETADAVYVFSETFDGSSTVWLSKSDIFGVFLDWKSGLLPLSYVDFDSGVTIQCVNPSA